MALWMLTLVLLFLFCYFGAKLHQIFEIKEEKKQRVLDSSLFTLRSSLQKMIHSPCQSPQYPFHFEREEEGGEPPDVDARLHGNHVDLQVIVS